MSERWAWRGACETLRVAMVAGLGWAGLATCAGAQPLRLDGPTLPAAGEGAAMVALAAELRREARAARVERRAGAEVCAALRDLAAALIEHGERAGEAGSGRVVAGLTLANDRTALDAAIGASSGSRLVWSVAAADVMKLAGAVPERASDLDRGLRDALAMTTQRVGPTQSAWITLHGAAASTDERASLEVLGRDAGLPPEAIEALAALDARLSSASGLRAYGPTVTGTRRLVSRAIIGVATQAAWVSAGGRDALRAELVESLREMADPATTSAGRDRLARVGTLGELAARFGAIEGAGRAKVRDAFGRLCLTLAPMADEKEARRVELLLRSARLLARREELDDEKQVVRQMRPAVRVLVELTRRTEEDLIDVLPDAMSSGEAISRPMVLTALAEHTRRVEDLELLIAVSDAMRDPIATGEPRAREDMDALAEGLLALAKEAVKHQSRGDVSSRLRLSAALEELRSAAATARDVLRGPGEADLRAAADGRGAASPTASACATMLGDRAKDLVGALDAARRDWVRGWLAGKRPTAEQTRRALELHAMLTLLADAAWAGRNAGAARAWPAWELSAPASARLARGLDDAVRRAAQAVVVADAGAARAIAQASDRWAVSLLEGRLASRLASAWGGGSEPVGGALAQVGLGGPDEGAWGREHRAELAVVCRYAEEAAASDGERSLRILSALSPRALALRARVGP